MTQPVQPQSNGAQPDDAAPQGQAPDGQGPITGADENGLYDLSAVPEELRPYLVDELKKVEANVTRKFQEAADFRKQWEPYAELGITEIDPDELKQLIEFRQIATDEDAFAEWWEEVGDKLGLFGDDNDFGDGDDDDFGQEFGPEQVEETLRRLLDERLGPVEQHLSAQEQEQRIQQATQEIRSELDALREEHGDFDEDAVIQLAMAYDDADDSIQRAFADYQKIMGGAERSFVESKRRGPEPANSGGRPNTTPEPITDFDSAAKAARERFAGTAGA